MAKYVRCGVLSNVSLPCHLADHLLHHGFVQVEGVTGTCLPIDEVRDGGGYPLPTPLDEVGRPASRHWMDAGTSKTCLIAGQASARFLG
jgi:hypothetical protein